MKPSLGRTVLYTLPAEFWQYVDPDHRIRPAVVTRVYDEPNLINCLVIYDPTDLFRLKVSDQTKVQEGIGTAGRWHWPPRIDEPKGAAR